MSLNFVLDSKNVLASDDSKKFVAVIKASLPADAKFRMLKTADYKELKQVQNFILLAPDFASVSVYTLQNWLATADDDGNRLSGRYVRHARETWSPSDNCYSEDPIVRLEARKAFNADMELRRKVLRAYKPDYIGGFVNTNNTTRKSGMLFVMENGKVQKYNITSELVTTISELQAQQKFEAYVASCEQSIKDQIDAQLMHIGHGCSLQDMYHWYFTNQTRIQAYVHQMSAEYGFDVHTGEYQLYRIKPQHTEFRDESYDYNYERAKEIYGPVEMLDDLIQYNQVRAYMEYGLFDELALQQKEDVDTVMYYADIDSACHAEADKHVVADYLASLTDEQLERVKASVNGYLNTVSDELKGLLKSYLFN